VIEKFAASISRTRFMRLSASTIWVPEASGVAPPQ
jgi:hypothetical protein